MYFSVNATAAADSVPSKPTSRNAWAVVFILYPTDFNRVPKEDYNPSTTIAQRKLEKLIDLINVMQREWESHKQNLGLWTPTAVSARQCCLL